MLAIRSATPPLSPADIPSTSSIMSTVLESFDLKFTIIETQQGLTYGLKLIVMIMKDQPIHINAEGLIGYKFLDRICIASTNSFFNFAISFSTAITSIYLQDIYGQVRKIRS